MLRLAAPAAACGVAPPARADSRFRTCLGIVLELSRTVLSAALVAFATPQAAAPGAIRSASSQRDPQRYQKPA